MNILLTNDDGYRAIGITELHKALAKTHSVYLVAPKRNCSGMSSAISLMADIEVEEIDENIYSVAGTPADCSYLGLLSIISEPIDLIVSGINLGANLGEDIFYSGTVGAAITGRRLNYVPIALSVAAYEPLHLEYLATKSLQIVHQASQLPADKNLLLNVNFPDLPESEIKGIKMTKLGKRGIPDQPLLIHEDGKSSFYRFGPSGSLMPNQEFTDMQAVADGYISISILNYDMSAVDQSFASYAEVFECE